jgi:hypothetical protein
MISAVIHCNPGIAWQVKRGAYFAEGFRRCGIPCRLTESRTREGPGVPVLLGTTFWRQIEADGGEYLLVDRCSFGDTERFMSLVWGGHGRRGLHPMPEHPSPARWERIGTPLKPWKARGSRVVLCGQTESFSPHYATLKDWYEHVPTATHFRKHPSGDNPTGLPDAVDFLNATAVTLNSSVGVQCVLDGIPTVTMDEAAMAWGVTGHDLAHVITPNRQQWCEWLSYTQWSDDEIREGTPWAFL